MTGIIAHPLVPVLCPVCGGTVMVEARVQRVTVKTSSLCVTFREQCPEHRCPATRPAPGVTP